MVKIVMSITIDEKLLSQWKQYVNDECINSSKIIEKMLDDHLKKRGIKKRKDEK